MDAVVEFPALMSSRRSSRRGHWSFSVELSKAGGDLEANADALAIEALADPKKESCAELRRAAQSCFSIAKRVLRSRSSRWCCSGSKPEEAKTLPRRITSAASCRTKRSTSLACRKLQEIQSYILHFKVHYVIYVTFHYIILY